MFGKSIFKSYSGLINVAARLLDPVFIILASLLAYYIRFPQQPLLLSEDYRMIVVVSVFCVIAVFPLFGLYSSLRGQSLFKQARSILLAWCSVVLIIIVVLFGLKVSSDYSRLWLGYWATLGLVFLLISRLFIYGVLQFQRRKGRNVRSVIIVGAGDLGKRLVRQVKASPWTGFKVIAFFDDNHNLHGQTVEETFVYAGLDDLSQFIVKNQIDEIWIALPLRAEERMKSLLYSLRHFTVNIKLIPDIFGFSLLNQSMTEIAGIPAVNLSDSPMGGINQYIKAIEDFILGLIIFILILPFAVLIGIGIKLSSPGPVLFKQKRHGWDGKVINVYKFRTMRMHTEEGGIVTQAKQNDSRVTRFGAFLRKTSLDELPQFYNVLQGRMSIVGPRPHAIEHNELYKNQVDKYMLRHMVKPGITGWAQVNGFRGETDVLEKMKKRIEFDLFYIENWSLWFDFKIIFLTIMKGFFHKNAY